jgi:hypothetical protein
MSAFDVFNGDADGLCALQQLRLDAPRAATLVTGTKRDIELLRRVPAGPGDAVTVLDVAVGRNRTVLDQLLARGATVQWFDHHQSADLPVHPLFEAHIDTAPDVCTSLLVDRHLSGRQRRWAVVGAFGDNLTAQAERLARSRRIAPQDIEILRDLGENLNYNAYGESEADLLIPPAELYARMQPYADPVAFAADEDIVAALHARRCDDLDRAFAIAPDVANEHVAIVMLPDTAWARRVGGTFAHALARRHPARAHVVLGPNPGGGYWASIRAPLAHPTGAGTLAHRFASGGGREGAAGIDLVPEVELGRFITAFREAFGG